MPKPRVDYSDQMPCSQQHRNFIEAYYKACDSSLPDDWFRAALMAKQWERAVHSEQVARLKAVSTPQEN